MKIPPWKRSRIGWWDEEEAIDYPKLFEALKGNMDHVRDQGLVPPNTDIHFLLKTAKFSQ